MDESQAGAVNQVERCMRCNSPLAFGWCLPCEARRRRNFAWPAIVLPLSGAFLSCPFFMYGLLLPYFASLVLVGWGISHLAYGGWRDACMEGARVHDNPCLLPSRNPDRWISRAAVSLGILTSSIWLTIGWAGRNFDLDSLWLAPGGFTSVGAAAAYLFEAWRRDKVELKWLGNHNG